MFLNQENLNDSKLHEEYSFIEREFRITSEENFI